MLIVWSTNLIVKVYRLPVFGDQVSTLSMFQPENVTFLKNILSNGKLKFLIIKTEFIQEAIDDCMEYFIFSCSWKFFLWIKLDQEKSVFLDPIILAPHRIAFPELGIDANHCLASS
jgi:hypothetical protein